MRRPRREPYPSCTRKSCPRAQVDLWEGDAMEILVKTDIGLLGEERSSQALLCVCETMFPLTRNAAF